MIKKLCVIGAGTMGAGIAQVAIENGIETTLRDVEDRFVQRGLDTINMLLSQMGGAAHGKGEHLGKAAAQTAGLISGLPTVQLQRTLDGLLYDIDRKTPNPIPVLFGKPR